MESREFMPTKNKVSQAGFTLVELSIVLVIIGLIVSSVLVGQDLVRSAEIRSTLSQLESFNAAVNTFKGKYQSMPGDAKGATDFGFTGDGNKDGLLVAVASGGATTFAANENMYFWNHLGSSGAALISGSYDGAALVSTTITSSLPPTKVGGYWGVFAGNATTTAEVGADTSEGGTNYFILGITGGTAGQANAVTGTQYLTALEAKNIDSKVDDGNPSLGTVRARGTATADAADQAPSSAVAGGTTTCTSYVATGYTTAPATNTYTTKATGSLCSLRFKMQG